MSYKALFLSVCVLVCACGERTSSAPELADETLDETKFRSHIKTLASDEFGGRAPASPGEELTVNYLVDQFKSLGLKPIDGDSYTQTVPLASVTLTNRPDIIIRGGEGEDLKFAFEKDQMLFSPRQREGSSIDESELVFVGFGINAPERNWNDYADVDVRGKTVVMFVNDPGYASQDPDLFNGNAMTIYGRWTYKYAEASRQGAAGAIIIHETAAASYPWSTVTGSWSGAQFDIVRENLGDDLTPVQSWVTFDAAKQLFEKAGLDLEQQYQAAQKPGFKALSMNLNASATLETAYEKTSSRNVGALIEGSEAQDEVFVYAAHWDHLGTNPAIEGDGIYNGAIDNASGTAALIEMARVFSNSKTAPRRSILFLAVGAEEQGLLGSRYYANHPLFPLDKTVAGINIDAMSIVGKTRDVIVVGYGQSELDNYLSEFAALQNRVVKPNPHPERGYYYRSDHFEFAKKGIPMLFAKSGKDHVEHGIEYGEAMSDDYSANRYHQPGDEYSEDWDLSGAMQDMELYYQIGRKIADTDEWPAWSEDSEFKQYR